MRLRHHSHGALLVHGMHSTCCHCPAARHSLPHDGHPGIHRGALTVLFYLLIYLFICLFLTDLAV